MEYKNLAKNLLDKLRTGDKSVENNVIDIKGEWYSNTDKSKNEWRDDLLKDVCAFANNSEGKTGYLIFGLKENPPHLNSISIKEDEATIQQMVRSNINPVPNVALERVTVENSHIYILSITSEILNLPYFAKLSDTNHHIYIRRGSSTDHCRKEDLDKMIAVKRDKQIDIRIEAQAIKSIRNINHKLKSASDDDFLSLLEALSQYTEWYSFKVYEEVLSSLSDIERRLSFRNKDRIRQRFFEIFQISLQTTNLVSPLNTEIPIQHINLLENSLNLCRTVCFNSYNLYNSTEAFGEAVYTLRNILRFVHLNKLKNLQNETLCIFDELLDFANKKRDEDALEWIKFLRKDALAGKDDSVPKYSNPLIKKFSF